MVHRVAVLDRELCHSRKCSLECIRFCPVNKIGSKCIVLGEDGKAVISEELCTGCGICVKKCPFEAIAIINLAQELASHKIHQYGVNGFRLYRLPIPKPGSVVGLVGRNGVGKTTAVNILSGSLKPNLGRVEDPPDWDEIGDYFHGTELKGHFDKIASGRLKVSVKPQAVYLVPKVWKGDALSLLKQVDSRGVSDELIQSLNLEKSVRKRVEELSGGELQRLAIAVTASKDADLYFFDEPSSYNDVFQRMAVSRVIHGLADLGKSVVLVEHDLTFLDYLSEYVHILYGEAGVYGIISGVQSARTGINLFLDGYLPAENMRFRDRPVTFNIYAPIEEARETPRVVDFTSLEKRYEGFVLKVSEGMIRRGEVVGVLGANALGKTTFVKMLSGLEEPDEGEITCTANVSYKPQYLSRDYEGDVKSLLKKVSEGRYETGDIQSSIILPLGIQKLYDKRVRDLSGGELQKVAIVACLLRDTEIYTLDEPSAFIDVEDRIVVARLIQRFIKSREKSALIVDHDIQLIDIISDSLMIFSGTPSESGSATSPMPKEKGMNLFLRDLGITYRRDIDTGRPRVNKSGSKLDRFQKETGAYYYLARAPTS